MAGSNITITPSIIATEALMQLENNLVMGNVVHRDYSNDFKKVGDTVDIRRPVRFQAVEGAIVENQDVEEGNTQVKLDQRWHTSWRFTTQDLTLSIEEYSERYIKPGVIPLANKMDSVLTGLYAGVYNWVGTPGQTVNSFADLALAPQRLDESAVPMDNRRAVLYPTDAWGMVSNLTGLGLLPKGGGDNASLSAYRQAELGRVANLDTFMDQNIARHLVGDAHGADELVRGTQSTTYAAVMDSSTWSMSFDTDGWTASKTLKAGDVFTIDGVYAVNPISKAALTFLQQFVVVSDVTANSTTTNATTLTISPPIITTGPYQNVSAVAANNATINYVGTASTYYPQNLVFHKNAMALVTVPLEMPESATWKMRKTRNNLSIRLIKHYDFQNDYEAIRLDVLFGAKLIYPELATRVSGSA